MEYITAGAAYFLFVFFKALQQRNVAFLHYSWVLPISYVMSATEIFVIGLVSLTVAQEGSLTLELLWYVLTVGTGGGLGAVVGMWIHTRATSSPLRGAGL